MLYCPRLNCVEITFKCNRCDAAICSLCDVLHSCVKVSTLLDALSLRRKALKPVITRVQHRDGSIYEEVLSAKTYVLKGKAALPDFMTESAHDASPSLRFDFSTADGRAAGLAFLNEHGYVVAANVLTPEDIAKGEDLFWDFISTLRMRSGAAGNVPIRGDEKTWNMGWPGDSVTGIISESGAGNSPFSWFIRSRLRVRDVFAAVWDTEDLLSSFDGFNSFRPWTFDPTWKTRGGWFHVDQNALFKPDKVCVQGLVALTATTSYSGGLTVIPGSHKGFGGIKDRIELKDQGDYIQIPKGDPLLVPKSKLVVCQAGDLCLWDSRTVHCNSPGISGVVSPKGSLLRLVCYTCMTPATFATQNTIEKRLLAAQRRQTTNHWPHELAKDDICFPSFGPNPYIVSDLIVGKNSPLLSAAESLRDLFAK